MRKARYGRSGFVRKTTRGAPFGFYALIPIDTTAVKQEYIRKWKLAQRDFAKRQREWERYCNDERPAFEQWMRHAFGARVSELRVLHEKIRERAYLIEQVEHHCRRFGKSAHRFYQELLNERQEGMTLLETLSAKLRAIDDDESEEEKRREKEDFEDELGASFDELIDELGDILGWDQRHQSHREDSKQQQLKLRDLYRKLCLRLHPDTGGQFTAETERLWHQVQDAYESKNLDRLEAIQAGLEIQIDPLGKHVSCSQLAAVVADLKHGVGSLRTMLRNARQEISWGFHSWSEKDRRKAEHRIDQDLNRDHYTLTDELRRYEKVLEQWERSFRRKAGKSAGAVRSNDA